MERDGKTHNWEKSKLVWTGNFLCRTNYCRWLTQQIQIHVSLGGFIFHFSSSFWKTNQAWLFKIFWFLLVKNGGKKLRAKMKIVKMRFLKIGNKNKWLHKDFLQTNHKMLKNHRFFFTLRAKYQWVSRNQILWQNFAHLSFALKALKFKIGFDVV